MSDKKSLGLQILPEIDFNITSTGITLQASQRLSTPRFLPFDISGKCKECKSTEAELDFVVTKEGVTVFCSRMKGSRFVPFDWVHDLPGHCFFKIKNKGRIFNIQHGQEAPVICHQSLMMNLQNQIQAANPPPPPPKQPPQQPAKLEPERPYDLKETLSEIYAYLDWLIPNDEVAEGMIERVKKAGGMSFESFLDALSAATSFTTNPRGPKLSQQQMEEYQQNSAKHIKMFAPKNPESRTIPLSVLLETLAAAATFLGDSQPASKPKMEVEEKETDTIPEVQAPTEAQAPTLDQYEAFFESLKAATTGMPITNQANQLKELKEQSIMMEEEENKAIASISPTSIPNIPIESPPSTKFL